MRVSDLVAVMERIAPTAHAEPWDNVGLLVGDPQAVCARVLLTIDYTQAVAEEAGAKKCDTVVAYHPPVFDGLKRVTAGDSSSLIFQAIQNGIAIYSPHTALDAAVGGTNDVLADLIGLTERQPLRVGETKSSHYKLVVFVPEKSLNEVSEALFNAGAGQIGNYSSCGFRLKGTGTFMGEAGSNPAVGKAGRMETTEEIRFETVVSIANIHAVLAALRKTHPYEEPAFDLNPLAAPPEASVGQGRVGQIKSPITLGEFVKKVKSELQLGHLLVNGIDSKPVTKVAICAGAGSELLDDAIAHDADLYLTGELRHHDVIKAERAGMNVISTLHSNSERPVLKTLKGRIEEQLKGVTVFISEADRDPLAVW